MDTPDLTLPQLDQIPGLAHDRLQAFFDSRRAEVTAIGAPVTSAVSYMERFVLDGGKRIRPLYAWAGFLAGSRASSASASDGPVVDPAAMLNVAASLELIQACALIHDDIIDSSDTRRGNPTVHRSVESVHRERGWHGDSGHFGESVAILAGDLALIWAEDMVQDSGLDDAALRRTRIPWRAMRTEVIGGQLLDIFLEASGSEDAELANNVNVFKTAAYTIERPLHLGAAIAGADEALISALRGYGRDIGVAFQLRDDQLGVYGDPAITGKPAGDDLREGKRTVLLATALRLADESDPRAARALREGVGVATDDHEITRLAKIIEETGAVDVIERRIDELTESGLAHLDSVDMDDEVSTTLRRLAIRSTSRRS